MSVNIYVKGRVLKPWKALMDCDKIIEFRVMIPKHIILNIFPKETKANETDYFFYYLFYNRFI